MDYTGFNRNNPLNAMLYAAWEGVQDYGWYILGAGLLGYVAFQKMAEWQYAREKQQHREAAMDPERRAQLDAQRAESLRARYDEQELAEKAQAEQEKAEQKRRQDKIDRYDNLQAGKSNKTSGLSGWRGDGGGGGDDKPHRPSWARKRPNPCGPKGG